jgi:hypothetical protein
MKKTVIILRLRTYFGVKVRVSLSSLYAPGQRSSLKKEETEKCLSSDSRALVFQELLQRQKSIFPPQATGSPFLTQDLTADGLTSRYFSNRPVVLFCPPVSSRSRRNP